jgi:hypothetical protein
MLRSRDEAAMRASLTAHRRYAALARGPFFEPVVGTVRAYLAAAVPEPFRTERDGWSLSCLPGTTPRRLSALTMRTMDALVINRPGPDERGAQALMIVARSALDGGFGGREAARDALPELRVVDSAYHEAGPDQALVSGAWEELVVALGHPVVVAAVRELAERMMGMGRTLHWRGHNYLLADDVLGRSA